MYQRILYTITAFAAKILKSLIEIISYLFFDAAVYSSFIVMLNQTQMAQNWILGGFGSAGYKIFYQFPDRSTVWKIFQMIAINAILVLFVIGTINTIWPNSINFISGIAGAGFAAILSLALYFRVHERLFLSIFIMEILPYTGILLLVFLGSVLFKWSLGVLFMISIFSAVIFALMILNNLSLRHKPASNTSLSGVYRTCKPFFIVSAINVFLSRADTSILNYLATSEALSNYIISSRFAAIIMTVSYIFQHFYLPSLIQNCERQEKYFLLKTIRVYMLETFFVGSIVSISLVSAGKIGVLHYFGFLVDTSILTLCCMLTLIIVPFTIFSYLLIVLSKFKLVVYVTLFGFLGSLCTLTLFYNVLSGVYIASIFLGWTFIIKLSEAIIFFRIINNKISL